VTHIPVFLLHRRKGKHTHQEKEEVQRLRSRTGEAVNLALPHREATSPAGESLTTRAFVPTNPRKVQEWELPGPFGIGCLNAAKGLTGSPQEEQVELFLLEVQSLPAE
jgi:hypothetical protein